MNKAMQERTWRAQFLSSTIIKMLSVNVLARPNYLTLINEFDKYNNCCYKKIDEKKF